MTNSAVSGSSGKGANIIAFSGAQGTGKSTAAKLLASQHEVPGISVGLVLDVERECPFPINREATHEAQEWIFVNQLRQESLAAAKYDIVFSDRTIMDTIAYSMVAGFHAQAKDMLIVWRYHEPLYRKITFRSTVTNQWNVADGCRDTDPVFRAAIEATLFELYKYAGLFCQARFSEV